MEILKVLVKLSLNLVVGVFVGVLRECGVVEI